MRALRGLLFPFSFDPVMRKELVGMGRHGSTFFYRGVYVGILVLVVWLFYQAFSGWRSGYSAMAEMGRDLFFGFDDRTHVVVIGHADAASGQVLGDLGQPLAETGPLVVGEARAPGHRRAPFAVHATGDLGEDHGPASHIGEQFEVVTLLIDPTETTARAKRARDIYVGQAGGNDARTGGWHFLTGTADDLEAAASSVGVSYRYDEDAKEYRHKPTVIVLTPEGQISSYLHGISYEPEKLQAAIDRAARSEVLSQDEQSSLGGFLLNCFGFDGSGNAPTGLVVMRIGGAVVMVFLFGLLGHYALRERRRRRAEKPA